MATASNRCGNREVRDEAVTHCARSSCSTVFALPVLAADDHKIIAPNEVKWTPAPASVPKGAEVAVLYGDPSKDGPFAMRLKMPKGYAIPPHTNPKPEIVTVVPGTRSFLDNDLHYCGQKLEVSRPPAVPRCGGADEAVFLQSLSVCTRTSPSVLRTLSLLVTGGDHMRLCSLKVRKRALSYDAIFVSGWPRTKA